ncbi:MAG: hypothetical protein PHQ43_06405 [Dehalococcoidales bacterium]|nr:hypothetical protein [Dehalococcoidales bacterium]
MGLKQEVDQLFNALVESQNVRQVLHPAGAVVAAVSDGAAAANAWSAYVQIVAAAVIPNPCWLVGVCLSTPVVEAFISDVAIASGAGAAEVDLAIVHAVSELFAVVEGKSLWLPLPYPIKIVGSPRLATRIRKSTAASAAGWSLKVAIATGIGT